MPAVRFQGEPHCLGQRIMRVSTFSAELCVNVNTTDATAGATALLLPAQNTHTLHDPIRDPVHARAPAALCVRSLSQSPETQIHSFTTHQHVQSKSQIREEQHLAHVTLASFVCSRHATRTALTDTDQSRHPYPGSTLGLNPCNHLAWLACGPWRTHIQAWHGMVWYGMAWGCGLRPPPRPREGHHRAGGAEAVTQGLGNSGAGGATGDVALPLGGRRE